jgi:hypothetical protein
MKGFLFFILFTFIISVAGRSQTTLVSGDVAVIYHLSETVVNGASGDRIGLVLLRNIAASTVFKVTENGSNGTQLDTDEGIITLTATTAHPIGKVINITLVSGTITSITPGFSTVLSGEFPYAIANGGDQSMVYTGVESAPTFIYSAHFNGTSWSVCNAGGTIGGPSPGFCGGSQSMMPLSGVTFAFGPSASEEYDNNWYSGPTGFANKAEALAQITDIGNWTGNDDPAPAENAANALVALGNLLPVEMMYFRGRSQKSGNLLSWATANQVGFSHFEIEHSKNGLDFELLETIEGTSNTYDKSSYDYLDSKSKFRDNYYRLKVVDLDGRYEYSNIIYIRSDQKDYHISVNPNPASNFLNIGLDGTLDEELTLELLRLDGALLQSITLREGDSFKYMDISNVPNGIYILKSKNSDVISQKIIKLQ